MIACAAMRLFAHSSLTVRSTSALLPALLGACTSLPPAEEPRPEPVAPAPVAEPAPAPAPALAPAPSFTDAQREQLSLLGVVCTTAYHLNAAGQVDQIGCTGTEPVATPVAAETLSPLGKSWRGHFATPTSDDTLVWFTTGDFMLSTRSDGKVKTVATPAVVSEADCVKLGAPAALDLLACKGNFPGLAHSEPDLLKVVHFGEKTTKSGLLAVNPQPLFSAHSAEDLWSGLCDDGLAVTYAVSSLSAVKNARTGAEDLHIEVERQGWRTSEMAAARRNKAVAKACKNIENMTDATVAQGLPPVPRKVISILLPFSTWETPALTKLQKEATDEMARADQRDRKKGLGR